MSSKARQTVFKCSDNGKQTLFLFRYIIWVFYQIFTSLCVSESNSADKIVRFFRSRYEDCARVCVSEATP